MAVEGFLNFYGVLRLGQAVFDEHYERLGLVPKLRQLLLVCNSCNIPKNHRACLLLDEISRGRNALVHPKTREVAGADAEQSRGATPVPERAQQAVDNMEAFFAAFVALVPDAVPLLVRRS